MFIMNEHQLASGQEWRRTTLPTWGGVQKFAVKITEPAEGIWLTPNTKTNLAGLSTRLTRRTVGSGPTALRQDQDVTNPYVSAISFL